MYKGKTIEVYTDKGVMFRMVFDNLVKHGFLEWRIIKAIEHNTVYRGMRYRIYDKVVVNK